MSRRPVKRTELAIDGAYVGIVDIPIYEVGNFVSGDLVTTPL
jgi:hypothetical protein